MAICISQLLMVEYWLIVIAAFFVVVKLTPFRKKSGKKKIKLRHNELKKKRKGEVLFNHKLPVTPLSSFELIG